MAAYIRRFSLTFSILALAAFAAGCGVDQSPVAPDETTITQAPGSSVFLTFGSGTLEPAGKITDDDTRTQTKKIDEDGGKLKIKERNGQGGKDDLKVEFKVPKGALDDEVEITMTLRGETLSDLVIEFAPGGLVFKKPAELKIKLGKNLVDISLETITIVHHSEGGSEWVEAFSLSEGRDDVNININVPGFSRYSMGP